MSDPNDYYIGWVCALVTELVAAQAFLDETHEGPEHVSPNDQNVYTLGRMGSHNVVIAALPDGEYGTESAASVATHMLHSFPNIRFGLLVGVGGGAPTAKHDIRLGDVVVGSRKGQGERGGIFQYDYGKRIQGQDFQHTRFLNEAPPILRAAVTSLSARYEKDGHRFDEQINSILQRNPRLQKKYHRPSEENDRLYHSHVAHPADEGDALCANLCGHDSSKIVIRGRRIETEDNPAIHYGIIASGNQLINDALLRDTLAKERDVMCFETAAGGLVNHFPCLVIRGISAYSDSHKNKLWQGYAAMTSAAYAKDLLGVVPRHRGEARGKRDHASSDHVISHKEPALVTTVEASNRTVRERETVQAIIRRNNKIKERHPTVVAINHEQSVETISEAFEGHTNGCYDITSVIIGFRGHKDVLWTSVDPEQNRASYRNS